MEPRSSNSQPRSILESKGEEVTAIITPVSICIALTVALVKTLNPSGASRNRAISIAAIYYSEEAGDSTKDKSFGALINAGLFVLFVTIATFILLYLFKHGYTKFIYWYFCFTGFSVFFIMAGILSLQLLQASGIAMDAVSFMFLLLNFAVTGILSLFVWPAPLAVKQGYLICTAVIVAYVFTWIPEWTTWTVLAAMAVYDCFAVLMPGGPLKELVEIAEERQVDIPALVYEARPRANLHRRAGHASVADSDAALISDRTILAAAGVAEQSATILEVSAAPEASPISDNAASEASLHTVLTSEYVNLSSRTPGEPAQQQPWDSRSRQRRRDRDPEQLLPNAIRLGLGDFIFYSVLVGRAVMYDMMTAIVAYLAIIAGLSTTLLLLAVHQKALPALPVSIALGMLVYFSSRIALEPFVLALSTKLVFF